MKRIVPVTIFTLVFALILVNFVDLNEIPAILGKTDWKWIGVSSILGLATSFLGPYRLKELLRIIGGKVNLLYIWGLANIGALISLIFPFSAGGLAMAYFLAKKIGTSYKRAFFVVFMDAFFGLPLTLVLGPVAVYFFYEKNLIPVEIGNIDLSLPILILLVFSLILISIRNNRFFRKAAILVISTRALMIRPLLITLAMFIVGNLQFYLLFLAFGMKPPIADFILANSLLGILGIIPSSLPAKIGQFETFGLLTLPYLLNLDKNVIFSLLLLQRVISLVVILVLGLVSLNILKISISSFRKQLATSTSQGF